MARRKDAGHLFPHTTDDITTLIRERHMVGTGRVAPQRMPREGGNPRVPQLATKAARMDAIHAALTEKSEAVLCKLRARERK